MGSALAYSLTDRVSRLRLISMRRPMTAAERCELDELFEMWDDARRERDGDGRKQLASSEVFEATLEYVLTTAERMGRGPELRERMIAVPFETAGGSR